VDTRVHLVSAPTQCFAGQMLKRIPGGQEPIRDTSPFVVHPFQCIGPTVVAWSARTIRPAGAAGLTPSVRHPLERHPSYAASASTTASGTITQQLVPAGLTPLSPLTARTVGGGVIRLLQLVSSMATATIRSPGSRRLVERIGP
jgi:hypothetical protein